MRKRVVVKLVLEVKEDNAAELEPADLLPDIVDGVRSWGGQREPFVDPLFYPYDRVYAEVRQGGKLVYEEV